MYLSLLQLLGWIYLYLKTFLNIYIYFFLNLFYLFNQYYNFITFY